MFGLERSGNSHTASAKAVKTVRGLTQHSQSWDNSVLMETHSMVDTHCHTAVFSIFSCLQSARQPSGSTPCNTKIQRLYHGKRFYPDPDPADPGH